MNSLFIVFIQGKLTFLVIIPEAGSLKKKMTNQICNKKIKRVVNVVNKRLKPMGKKADTSLFACFSTYTVKKLIDLFLPMLPLHLLDIWNLITEL